VTAAVWLEVEPGGGHPGLELRRILKEARVQDEIAIGRVGSDSEIGGPGVEIDGLRSRQDDSVTVGRERSQHVEEGTPCSYISHVELERLRDIM
jgi:hypothetical protein